MSAVQERRNQRARERGFISYGQQRRHNRNVRNRRDLGKLPPTARQARQQALDAIAVTRREGIGLSEAARQQGISPQAVAFWSGTTVEHAGGTWRVANADRLYRSMFVYSDGQKMLIDVRGSRVASNVGRYHAAVGHYLNTGDDSRLRRLNGVKVAGVELETDPDVIDQIARRGVIEFDSIYRMVN